MKVSAQPDIFRTGDGGHIKFLGPSWIETSMPLWQSILESRPEYVSIDLSNVSFVTLFDWLNLVAIAQSVIQKIEPRQLDLDLLGTSNLRLIDPATLLAVSKDEFGSFSYPLDEQKFSFDRYRLAGFLESLDSYSVLNRPSSSTKVIYPGLTQQLASFRSFYAAKFGEAPKVVLGLQRISTKDDCKLFLEDSQILSWRRTMDTRFQISPLFESDEVWRVLCHELAVNIWEHSGVDGFIAARVVESALTPKATLRRWCRWTYPSRFHPLLKSIKGSFLELCVADAGSGFVDTLLPVVARATKMRISTGDVISFAFDELGTCKDKDESWATARHGLCRVLGLVSKYGGALRVRSGDTEVYYVAEMQRFARRKEIGGYEPQGVKHLKSAVPGAQLQILLPLIPRFERDDVGRGRSVLELGLPSSFRTQADQARGHLAPLLELLDTPESCVGTEERKRFRRKCESLCRQLLERSRVDPIIFDFSGLNWPAAQLESFLYYLQNVLQYRPALLVEIDSVLANEVLELEWSQASTMMDLRVLDEEFVERRFAEFSEKRFLETYSSVHVTVLGVTRDKKQRHIFGLPSRDYELALLSLIGKSRSIEELCREYPLVKESVIRAILTPANLLFQQEANRSWISVWTSTAISVESNRAVVEHFDAVAVRSKAWRGRRECDDEGRERFYLPWMNLWRKEFLQTTRILNRGRHSDEIAQRLLFRLRSAILMQGLELSDVRVLVCISAPAMLLASALHRWWWPEEPRPAIADLGYYVFMGDQGGLPVITGEGGIVIVQDVVDDGRVSQSLVEQLADQGRSVICILALARFVDDVTVKVALEKICSVDVISLVNVSRPATCAPPIPEIDDHLAFWVEPRSLRPVRLRTLRREFVSGRDPDLERRNRYLEKFESSEDECLISSGHFVYGLRHFVVTVDIRRALTGRIGDEIARWVADVCEGTKTNRAAWEREEGYNLEGDVTAVLMPPHSQIHYIWPKVENLLAQRGRRQPMWLLEPTLFTGSGPAYGLPLQFRYQIGRVVEEAVKHKRRIPLRIFVLDDAIATGRTAVTILSTIIREVRKAASDQLGSDVLLKDFSPIEWIRYFALINETDHANYVLWRSINALTKPAITFAMEEYAPFMGVLVYNESNCPVCKDRARLVQLSSVCDDNGAESAKAWVRRRIDQLRPIAIDGRGFESSGATKLPERLDVLSRNRLRRENSRYRAAYVDTAIWRFYELMYLSYPPSELLISLEDAWSDRSEVLEREFERYRWAVLEWCIRSWRRVLADSGAEVFRVCAIKEIEEFTGLTEPLLESISTRYDDHTVREIIGHAINMLAGLESERVEIGKETDRLRIEQAIQLDTALQLSFFNIQRFDRERTSKKKTIKSPEFLELLEMLDSAAIPLDRHGHSFLRFLHRRLERPSRFADPRWALEVLAESLYRGRSLSEHAGSHQLLPRLLFNVMKGSPNSEQLRLLNASLVLFLAAIKDLLPYCEVNFSFYIAHIKDLSKKVLEWLGGDPEVRRNIVPEVRYLFIELDLDGRFCREFGTLFHEKASNFLEKVEIYAAEVGGARLTFEYEVDDSVANLPLLTHLQRLHLVIGNRTVDPIKKLPRKRFRSRVKVLDDISNRGMCFRILTNFASAEETRRLMDSSRNAQAEEGLLKAFGVIFTDWHEPEDTRDLRDGLRAQSEIVVPKGFGPREIR